MSVGVTGSAMIATAQSGGGLPDDAFRDNRTSPSWPGVNGDIRAITVFNGELIIAGSSIAGKTPANGIASWNGSSWSVLGSGLRSEFGMPGQVEALAVFNGKLIAGGGFTSAGGIPLQPCLLGRTRLVVSRRGNGLVRSKPHTCGRAPQGDGCRHLPDAHLTLRSSKEG